MKKNREIIRSCFALTILSMLLPFSAQAVQTESPIDCIEGNTPLLNYGDYTSGCTIEDVSDRDQFALVGADGDMPRFIVRQTGGGLDPRLEIRDPDGVLLHDGNCAGGCTIEIEPQDFNIEPSPDNTLAKSGVYLIAVSDQGSNETGTYQLNAQCLDAFCGLTPAFAVCDIEMSQAAYIDGETITAQQFRVANPGSSDIAVELKAWFETPTGAVIRTLNVPSINLSAGFDIDLGPITFFTVQPTTPRGTWEYSCRLLDPVTGRQRSFDRTTFELQ